MNAMQLRSHLLIPDDIALKHALIIGAGTVGSNVAMALASIGLRSFDICDYDTVGFHNLPSQCFGVLQVGENKAEAMCDNLSARFGRNIEAASFGKFSPAYTASSPPDIIISAADSMQVRKMVYMWTRGTSARVVDSRCAGHEVQTWAYTASDRTQADTYASTLHADAEATPLPCGGEMYPVAGMAAAINTLAAINSTEFFYRLADTEISAIH